MDPLAWVPLAQIARPHGIKGELRLNLYNRDSDLLLSLKAVLVRLVSGEERSCSIESSRRAGASILMKLQSIDDRTAAVELQGATVCVRRHQFAPLEQGEFYVCDVEGARVFVRSETTKIEAGRVRTLQRYPTVDVLMVVPEGGGEDYEVPLTADYIEQINPLDGTVILRSVEGIRPEASHCSTLRRPQGL